MSFQKAFSVLIKQNIQVWKELYEADNILQLQRKNENEIYVTMIKGKNAC